MEQPPRQQDKPSSHAKKPASKPDASDERISVTSPKAPKFPGRATAKTGAESPQEARHQRLLVARALLLPTEFVLIPLLGLYGGRFLDHRWGTSPWLMVLGGFLGLGAALRSLFEAFKV